PLAARPPRSGTSVSDRRRADMSEVVAKPPPKSPFVIPEPEGAPSPPKSPRPTSWTGEVGDLLPQERPRESSGVKPEKPRARWSWRLLVASGAALVLVALAFDAWDLARRAWEASSALGALVAALTLLAIVGALKLMADEL